MMKILTLCGSLRKESSNGEVLKAFALLAPEGVSVERFSGMCDLPHFNPDLDVDPLPKTVVELREQVAACSGIVISTPEYVHALPGAFKNLLDWLVSDPRFMRKLVGILQVDRGSRWAFDSLREVIKTMNAEIVEDAVALLPLNNNRMSRNDLLQNEDLGALLLQSMNAMVQAMQVSASG